MDRRRFLMLTGAGAVLAATPARAELIPLNTISGYFNSFDTAQADFTQYNAGGSQSRGRVYMHRPGRARFEYTDENNLVMAGGGQIAIFDAKSNAEPQQYPLARTPLNMILEKDVDLSRQRFVVDHREEQGRTMVTARDPQRPEVGTIQLFFEADPIRLVQWTVIDETGSRTAVVLQDFETDVRLPSSLFNIPLEMQKRGR
ncbi:MAG: outer membrane lipoprotein carrier protein LolA [Pseudomonadota bacterium]